MNIEKNKDKTLKVKTEQNTEISPNMSVIAMNITG